MEYFIFYLFFFQIFYIVSPIPNWDLSAQSINLMSSNDNPYPDGYTLYDKTGYGIQVILKKYIKRVNGVITNENYVTVIRDGNTLGPKKVDFNDIDSHYTGKLNYDILICPKGKFHPYDFKNGKHIDPPTDFEDKGGWDLRCFDHSTGYFYLFYLLNNGKNFYFRYTGIIREKSNFWDSYFYDYKLQSDNKGDNYKYKFSVLRYESNWIKLCARSLEVNKGSYDGTGDVNYVSIGNDNNIINAKDYTQAYFNPGRFFYYFTYNNAYDFESGYSTIYVNFEDDEVFKSSCSNPGLIKNTNSPLTFVDNVQIQEMKLIPETKYIYYKIYNQDKDKTYYGFIDIELNKVLYNIEGNFKTFIPISTHEMLAITETSAYKICIIKTESNECSNTCTNTNLILDPDRNKCQSECDIGKIKLMPDGICIDSNL